MLMWRSQVLRYIPVCQTRSLGVNHTGLQRLLLAQSLCPAARSLSMFTRTSRAATQPQASTPPGCAACALPKQREHCPVLFSSGALIALQRLRRRRRRRRRERRWHSPHSSQGQPLRALL